MVLKINLVVLDLQLLSYKMSTPPVYAVCGTVILMHCLVLEHG